VNFIFITNSFHVDYISIKEIRKEVVNLMKNGKKPTLSQKKEMKLHGLQPENWLVIKDTREFLEVVSRMELKRIGTGRKRTRRLYRSE